MSDESNFGSFLMGFTVGALAGAIVSLLMAPQTGEETRQVIKEKASELGHSTKVKVEKLAEETTEAAEEVAEAAQE